MSGSGHRGAAGGAFGRWLELGGSLALAAVVGAGLFMLSDALLAPGSFPVELPRGTGRSVEHLLARSF
jgi:hypothetical protein